MQSFMSSVHHIMHKHSCICVCGKFAVGTSSNLMLAALDLQWSVYYRGLAMYRLEHCLYYWWCSPMSIALDKLTQYLTFQVILKWLYNWFIKKIVECYIHDTAWMSFKPFSFLLIEEYHLHNDIHDNIEKKKLFLLWWCAYDEPWGTQILSACSPCISLPLSLHGQQLLHNHK